MKLFFLISYNLEHEYYQIVNCNSMITFLFLIFNSNMTDHIVPSSPPPLFIFSSILPYFADAPFFYLFVYLFIYLFICLFICLFIYLFIYLFISLFIYLFIC